MNSSSGQGIVEYILVLVVVIAVALAVSAAFFKPFNDWARNYMGDYIYCLLDQGELPSLGGEEAVSECEKGFEKFSAGGGRPAKSGSESSESEKGGRSRLNSGNSSDGGGGAGGASRRRNRRSGSALGSGFDSGGQGAGSKTSDVTNNFSQSSRFRSGGRVGGGVIYIDGRRRSEAYVGITGYIAQERERIQKREEKVRSVGKAVDSSSGYARRGAKTLPFEIRSKKDGSSDLTGIGDWSWGEWLRILFIIVIIVALVLFVGGQVMQISKSMEKE